MTRSPDEDPQPPALTANPSAAVDAWHGLRRYTPARIALGRVGASLPTTEVLAFSMAHARARDAVHLSFDADALASSLDQAGFQTLRARSQAASRPEYLRRPDLGRQLHPGCKGFLRAAETAPAHRLTIVVGDGLSSLAPARHALPLLIELRAQLERVSAWSLDSIVIASEARVALADEVGELRGAEAVVMLLGERPGLSSPDSLGIYMTYAPRRGRSDAERNCLSNVRREGLSYAEAAYKLLYLLDQARNVGASGVVIKDSSDWSASTSLPASVPGSKQLSS
jgi:ethanolamine ammonia-lyase small subunit